MERDHGSPQYKYDAQTKKWSPCSYHVSSAPASSSSSYSYSTSTSYTTTTTTSSSGGSYSSSAAMPNVKLVVIGDGAVGMSN